MTDPHLRYATLIDSFEPSEPLEIARILLKRHADVTLSPLAAALHDAGLLAPSTVESTLVETASSDADTWATVARHDLPLPLPVDIGLPLASAPAMQPTHIEGPFRGATSPFWLWFYRPVKAYTVWAAGSARPTFILTQARLPRAGHSPYPIQLTGGTIWILANALDSSFPADAYIGLTVQDGTLSFPHPLTLVGDRLTYSGTLNARLEVTPAVATTSGTACAARPSVHGPEFLHVTWHPGNPVHLSLGPASATFTGVTFDLTGYTGPPQLDAELNVVFFPCHIAPTVWDSQTLSSNIVKFQGSTALDGGWALSLVRPDASGHLGEALGPGLFVFHCHDPLKASWQGAVQPITLNQSRLIVREGQFMVTARNGSAATSTQKLKLWALRADTEAPRIPLALRVGGALLFTYICDAPGGEALYATCKVDLALDKPVSISGTPLVFSGADLAYFGIERAADVNRVRVVALARPVKNPSRAVLALRNALIAVTEPIVMALEGTLADDGAVDSGALTLALSASAWLPTLPDPYVTNYHLANREGGINAVAAPSPSLILAVVSWATPSSPSVAFTGALATPQVSAAAPTPDPTGPVRQTSGQVRVPTQTDEGRSVVPAPDFTRAGGTGGVSAQPVPSSDKQNEQIARFDAGVQSFFATGTGRGLRLLDVSTNKDLLGVELVERNARADVAAGAGQSFQLAGLDVCTQAAALHVFTLPQVQWEPVRTLDRDQDIPHLGYFPTPLASVTDGGATQIAVRSVRLVPAVPDLAVDAIVEEFASGKAAGMVTTLPFGLRALLVLRPTPSPDGRKPDTVERNQPVFLKPNVRGGAQIAFTAESGPGNRDDSSYFDGYTLQLRNGVALQTGAPLGLSVLGGVVDPADTVQEMFNNEFGPAGASPRVPVTRLDICGYGGSTFSDWLNRQAAYADAAKVQFQVVVGRTALEVVKFATVLYPWGIRLTRTVTIERKGGGGVIRRDSGWQPSSPGLFQFPTSAVPGQPYVVHPGLLLGLFNVRNIRSTGMSPISFPGRNGKQVTLAPKFFDAQAHIDGLEGATELAATGILGYLQIEPIGEPLHEEDLRTLLDQQGPAGGPVDGMVQVGGSGFRVRATRIEVGIANGPTGRPELVGAVRSAPRFHQEGAWSAVRLPGPSNPHGDAEAVNANEVKGLPLVREGQLQSVTGDTMHFGPRTDYRFADAADLHRPDDPVWEYGFLQTSPAHVFLFPRPHVDAGVRELRSRTTPRFADIYARCTTKGLFPPTANAITLPANALVVDPATGGFGLSAPVSLASPRAPLTIAQEGADVIQLDYSGATLALTMDQNAWSLEFPNLELWTDITGVSRVSGLRTHLVAGTNERPVARDIESLLKPEIEKALTFLPGFGARPKMGPIDLAATNTVHETKLSLIVERHWKFGEVPGIKFSVGGKGEFGWSTDNAPPPMAAPGTTYTVGLSAWGQVEGKIPIYGILYLLLGAEIEIGAAAEFAPGAAVMAKFLFELKAYIGLGINAGIFDGSIAIGYHLAIEGATVKNGIFGQLQAEVDLKVVSVGVEGELGGLWYDDTTHPPSQHASDLSGEIQINVELLFIGFHFSVEFQKTEYFS